MSLRPRPEIESLRPAVHGSIDYAEAAAMGLNPEEIVDFSVCLNPYPLPGIEQAIRRANIGQYPDSEATVFRRRLAEKLGIGAESILAGSGTTEIIRLIALAYFRRGDRVLIPQPTFSEYEVACRISGAEPVLRPRLKAEEAFSLDAEETAELARRYRPRAIFICNPNNPTGRYLSRQQIEAVLEAAGESLLVLDEAYINFIDDAWSAIDLAKRENVVVLRSMTKDYALAGLRLGYAIAHREVIENLRRVRPPWNVNVIAQEAGLAALASPAHLEESRRKIKEAKEFLVIELGRLGLKPLPAEAHFFLVKAGDAGAFRRALLRDGILVRDCASFGLPDYVRISPRTLPECRKLISAARRWQEEPGG